MLSTPSALRRLSLEQDKENKVKCYRMTRLWYMHQFNTAEESVTSWNVTEAISEILNMK